MQQGCETIYPVVIHNTVHGKDVKNAAEKTNSPYMGEVFGPPSKQKIGKKIMFFSCSRKFISLLTNGLTLKLFT